MIHRLFRQFAELIERKLELGSLPPVDVILEIRCSWINQSTNWLIASWFVGELFSKLCKLTAFEMTHTVSTLSRDTGCVGESKGRSVFNK